MAQEYRGSLSDKNNNGSKNDAMNKMVPLQQSNASMGRNITGSNPLLRPEPANGDSRLFVHHYVRTPEL